MNKKHLIFFISIIVIQFLIIAFLLVYIISINTSSIFPAIAKEDLLLVPSGNTTNTTTSSNTTHPNYYTSSNISNTFQVVTNVSHTIDPNEKSSLIEEDLKAEDTYFDENGVQIAINKDSISNTGVEIIITNTGGDPGGWGESYSIEKKVNNSWERVSPISDVMFTEVSLESPYYYLKEKINWEKFYGKLSPGIYRIVKDRYSSGYKYYYSDEFEIK